MKSVGWATLISLSVHGALGWAVLRAPAGWFGASHPIEPISVEIIESPVEIEPEARRVTLTGRVTVELRRGGGQL